MRIWENWVDGEKFIYIRMSKCEAGEVYLSMNPGEGEVTAHVLDKELKKFGEKA